MPETPDFDQLAEQLRLRLWGHDRSDLDTEARVRHSMVEALRQVWNARGAADAAKIYPLTEQWGVDDAHGSELLAAYAHIRSLDR